VVYGRVTYTNYSKGFQTNVLPIMYVMMYTCKEALFTLSVISHAQNLNRNNADTCKIKYIKNILGIILGYIYKIILLRNQIECE